jgi:hypothetical protein
MTFVAEVRASLSWTWDDGAVDDDRFDSLQEFSDGNGAGQAEAVWHLEDQVLAAGESLALDLTALEREVLGDLNTIAMVTVTALLLSSDAASVGSLAVGGAAANAWSAPFAAASDQAVVAPDGILLLSSPAAGWPVDSGDRILQLAAVGGDVTYSVVIVGTLTPQGSGSGSGQ